MRLLKFKNFTGNLLLIFLLQISINAFSQEVFFQVLPENPGKTQSLDLKGIPFNVIPTDKGFKNLANDADPLIVAGHSQAVQSVFFLGMVTEKMQASEWWGPTERWYAFNNRMFIGDQPGKIFIVYSDETVDVIPLIFGVNLWNYELLSETKTSENYLTSWGPFREPFLSDRHAKALLDSSLILMENDTVKGGKYILGVKTRIKPISKIIFINDNVRTAGFYITAITCQSASAPLNPDWKMYDERYFAQKKYYPSMDKMARRLYQFRDELPASDPYRPPLHYDAPMVKFTGTPLAEIYSNVYAYNLHDMRTNKVDAKGGMHTSSGNLGDFGIYIGMGTFKKNALFSYNQVWTRDLGRCMMEVIESGEKERSAKAGDEALKLLYDPSVRFSQPNWKRVANASTVKNDGFSKFVSGKENDGHGAMMLFLYRLIQHQCVDKDWIIKNMKSLRDAAEWFCWQMDNPEESGFDKVLSSETEASTQQYGSFDLFSNYTAFMALKAFARIALQNEDKTNAVRWNQYADKLHEGIINMFTATHPRYGKIFVDITNDVWTWEYKRFVPLFLANDLYTYDLAIQDPELNSICYNTYLAQKEDYFSYAAGRQMGYGQGYISQAAILLDEFADMKGYLEQAAAFCYHHYDYNYIVCEGVVMHPSGRFWFRNSDLGNGVQQAEIVKTGRLLIGLDDLNPAQGLNVIPRLPADWTTIEVKDYPVIALDKVGNSLRSGIYYKYKRIEKGFEFCIETDKLIRIGQIRLGPFNSKNIKITDSKMPFTVRKVREQNFVYLDLSSMAGKKFSVKAVSLN